MLSMTSQYALRALAYIAAQETESVLGRTIAEETGIPKNYLSKILIGFNNAGIVNAARGTGGGYRLTGKPESIMLDRIVAVFDRDVVNPCCLLGRSQPCSDENACSAHFAWRDTRAALTSFLARTSLADISPLKTNTPATPRKRKAAVNTANRRKQS